MVEFALAYASKGWHVIPCYPMRGGICGCGRPQCVSPGKHPANNRGLTEATVDAAQIRAWWSEMPDASIGVVMEPSGLVALDLDLYHKDLEKLAALERDLGPLPQTVTQRSGSGEGYHAIFVAPGFPVRGVIGGIVVRSKAYIIVAPSNHASGGNYTWQEGLGPSDIPVAELPESWKSALKKSAEVGQVGIPTEEPEWLAKVPADKRIADMRAHFAKEAGEVKGTSLAGTTFNVVRTAIRSYGVRDPEVALEAAMEFDAKCVPPWGARMARHVWSAYQRATSPVWGSAYRGEDQRLEALGLDSAPVQPAFPTPKDIEVQSALEDASKSRSKAVSTLDKKLLKAILEKEYATVNPNIELAAQALVRNAPLGTTDGQLATYFNALLIPDEQSMELIRAARAALGTPNVTPGASLLSLAGMVPPPPVEPDEELGGFLLGNDIDDMPPPQDDNDLLTRLTQDEDGNVENKPHNIARILRWSSEFCGRVRFNILTKHIEITAGKFTSLNENTLAVEVMNWLSSRWKLSCHDEAVGKQLLAIARRNDYNPIAEYLNSLTWDGVRRIDTWLRDYCGAEDTEFNRRVGAMWLISACARGINPGSKVDTVLVLEGKQGAKKSTALNELAGTWFSDTPLVIGNKDSLQAASSRWIIELAELASLRSSETEAQKAFISAKVDNFRPPYGKAMEEFKRFAIFGGSTNENEYLPDATGNRRYWPVLVTKCDTLRLRNDRNQLWAEAVFRYKSAELNPELAHPLCPGERWWFETDEEHDEAAKVVQKRRPENTWAGLIREWTRRTSVVGAGTRRQWTLAEIAKGALDIEIEKLPSKQKQITTAIKEAGLLPTTGPEGQPMWKVPDASGVDSEDSEGRALRDAN